MKKLSWRRKNRKITHIPREEIEKAVAEYLKNGGVITDLNKRNRRSKELKPISVGSKPQFALIYNDAAATDKFLMGAYSVC